MRLVWEWIRGNGTKIHATRDDRRDKLPAFISELPPRRTTRFSLRSARAVASPFLCTRRNELHTPLERLLNQIHGK